MIYLEMNKDKDISITALEGNGPTIISELQFGVCECLVSMEKQGGLPSDVLMRMFITTLPTALDLVKKSKSSD